MTEPDVLDEQIRLPWTVEVLCNGRWEDTGEVLAYGNDAEAARKAWKARGYHVRVTHVWGPDD